jgi:hypothetical protein
MKALKRMGIQAEGHVLDRRRLHWSQEPYRVRRRAGRPVYVITEDA